MYTFGFHKNSSSHQLVLDLHLQAQQVFYFQLYHITFLLNY